MRDRLLWLTIGLLFGYAFAPIVTQAQPMIRSVLLYVGTPASATALTGTGATLNVYVH